MEQLRYKSNLGKRSLNSSLLVLKSTNRQDNWIWRYALATNIKRTNIVESHFEAMFEEKTIILETRNL